MGAAAAAASVPVAGAGRHGGRAARPAEVPVAFAERNGYRAAGTSTPVPAEGAMRRLGLFALAVVLGLGCATESHQGPWDEFWKDLRGDNQQMRSSGADIGGGGAGRNK